MNRGYALLYYKAEHGSHISFSPRRGEQVEGAFTSLIPDHGLTCAELPTTALSIVNRVFWPFKISHEHLFKHPPRGRHHQLGSIVVKT